MLLEEHQSVVKFIESSKHDAHLKLKEASTRFGCPYNTVLAIFFQQVQKKLKRLSYLHSDPHVQADHLKHFESQNNGSEDGLYKFAIDLGLPPVMLAKMLIELLGLNKNTTSTQILKNTNLIKDNVFKLQVQYCLENDSEFGPNIDVIKKSIGDEYELILKDKLTFMNISFKDENVLRDQGYDKTPDLLLTVPIAIGNHVINWIESKASFGDEYTHRQYLREQYWSYWNRFGSGLVIYWFGFIDELADQTLDKGIIIMDYMPSKITTIL